MYQELIHTEIKEGFTIKFFACEEHDSPIGHFASGDDKADQEIIDKINDGTYQWFVAKVTASKNGIELGVDYLGGCCYESAQAFVTKDGYYPDMVAEAINQAKANIQKLTV